MYSVIIVEDDPMVASINRQYVELEPSFSVKQSFKSGQDALSWLSREEADLIILDYYMPLMTGKEFIDRLHSMGRRPLLSWSPLPATLPLSRSCSPEACWTIWLSPLNGQDFARPSPALRRPEAAWTALLS